MNRTSSTTGASRWLRLTRAIAVLGLLLIVAGASCDAARDATAGPYTKSDSAARAMPADTTTTAKSSVELPRLFLVTRYVAAPGQSIAVHEGQNLQSAINSAHRGDEVVLDAGATYPGPITLPAKSGTAADGWVIIRSSALGALPEGVRVSPADAAKMARIVVAQGQGAAILTAPGASGYRLAGLEVTAAATATQVNSLVAFGDGSSAQNSLTSVPSRLVLDRSYVHGHATLNLQRCVALNSASTAVVDSHLSDCHFKGADAQAILGYNGPGPFKIVNNYLEGSGENVMFGGADPYIPNLVPADLEIRRNYFFKPLEWKGVWTIKNLLELKMGKRVLLEGNVFENSWADGQTGFAMNFKSVNQGGSAPWAETSDVTFRYNVVRNTAGGVTIAAHPEQYPVVPASRIVVENNVFTGIGASNGTWNARMFQLLGSLANVTIAHNTLLHTTFPGSGQFILMDNPGGAPGHDLAIRDNVATWGGPYGAVWGNAPQGTQALALFSVPYAFERNVVIGLPSNLRAMYPTNNSYVDDVSQVGFANVTANDLRLTAASRFHAAATDGLDPGADVGKVTTAIAGVTAARSRAPAP